MESTGLAVTKRDRFFGAHELFDRDDPHGGSSDRAFGLVMAGFCALFGAIGWLRGTGYWPWWIVAASLFAAAALICRQLLAPLNRLWTRLGLLLNAIVGPVVLFVLYYACITPMGVLMRAAGKAPLRLRRDPNSGTYWIRRAPPGPLPGSLKNQY